MHGHFLACPFAKMLRQINKVNIREYIYVVMYVCLELICIYIWFIHRTHVCKNLYAFKNCKTKSFYCSNLKATLWKPNNPNIYFYCLSKPWHSNADVQVAKSFYAPAWNRYRNINQVAYINRHTGALNIDTCTQ